MELMNGHSFVLCAFLCVSVCCVHVYVFVSTCVVRMYVEVGRHLSIHVSAVICLVC